MNGDIGLDLRVQLDISAWGMILISPNYSTGWADSFSVF